MKVTTEQLNKNIGKLERLLKKARNVDDFLYDTKEFVTKNYFIPEGFSYEYDEYEFYYAEYTSGEETVSLNYDVDGKMLMLEKSKNS